MKAYNIGSQSLIDIVCHPLNYTRFYGLINLFDSCDNNTIIASAGDNTLYAINLENYSSTPIVTLSEISGIMGMASANEYLASACPSFVFDAVDCTLGIDKKDRKDGLKIFPNPTSDILTVETPGNLDQIEIYDFNARLVTQTQNTETIDLSALEQGVYILKVKMADRVLTSKIIKQ